MAKSEERIDKWLWAVRISRRAQYQRRHAKKAVS